MSTRKFEAERIPMAEDIEKALSTVQGAVEASLIDNRRDFLRFLVRRLGDEDIAEDVLQQFYLRAVDKGSGLRQSESVVAWLYRLLRTTLVDHYRRETSRRRREADYARMEVLSDGERDAELEGTVCACFEALLPTLKSDHAEILRRVDLLGTPTRDVARDLGLTPNNLRVRLHRARQALKHGLLLSCRTCAEHGCLDCDCGKPGQTGGRAEAVARRVP